MVGRHQEVAAGQPVAERAGLKADGLHGRVGGEKAPGVAAVAEPLDRTVLAEGGDHHVADRQGFHLYLPCEAVSPMMAYWTPLSRCCVSVTFCKLKSPLVIKYGG